MSVQTTPGFDLQPSSEQVLLQTNYITNFDFLNQYLPDTYEKEFERYGNRSVASFLRMVLITKQEDKQWRQQLYVHYSFMVLNFKKDLLECKGS